MRTAVHSLSLCLLVSALPAAWANGGGGMSMPSMPATPRTETPQQKARGAYNDGVREVKKADKAQSAALEAGDAGRKDKAAREAHERYASALGKFRQAVQLDDTLPEAWNYLGYCYRKVGDFEDALAAYGKALALKPGYGDALEYRGEAYLAVNRVPEAQQTYLDLYAGNRTLAAKLLAAMRDWVAAQRASAAGAGANAGGGNLDELEKWIQERAQIAAQTAALTREGTASSWR